ncbi:MAG: NAD-dependent epimerase/dehydratase family protein [Bacillus sp. (in: firmicutes)]
MNKLNKLLITGASGFTGQHACRHFVKTGFDVTAMTGNNAVNEQVRTEHCDLTDKVGVINIVKEIKPDYLLHLAGHNHVGESWLHPGLSLEANVMSTLHLIDALREENPSCKIVVVGSALQFVPHHITTLKHPYSLSKTLQALIAQSWQVLYNMHISIAKSSNLIGPGKSNGVCSIFAKKIVYMEENKIEKILEVNNLQAQRDFIDVRDAVRAYEILLTTGISGEVYEIVSGKSHSLEDLINIFKSLTNVEFHTLTQIKKIREKIMKLY